MKRRADSTARCATQPTNMPLIHCGHFERSDGIIATVIGWCKGGSESCKFHRCLLSLALCL